MPVQWGDGYEKIKVVGRHRGSHQYVTMVMQARWLTNWRAKLVYSNRYTINFYFVHEFFKSPQYRPNFSTI